jgi:uncharacterized protein YjiK
VKGKHTWETTVRWEEGIAMDIKEIVYVGVE